MEARGAVLIGGRAPRCVKTALCAWVESHSDGPPSTNLAGSTQDQRGSKSGLRRRRRGGVGVVGWTRNPASGSTMQPPACSCTKRKQPTNKQIPWRFVLRSWQNNLSALTGVQASRSDASTVISLSSRRCGGLVLSGEHAAFDRPMCPG